MSAESGVGLEQALSWENAIRQALMPVTARHSPKGVGSKLIPLEVDFECVLLESFRPL